MSNLSLRDFIPTEETNIKVINGILNIKAEEIKVVCGEISRALNQEVKNTKRQPFQGGKSSVNKFGTWKKQIFFICSENAK